MISGLEIELHLPHHVFAGQSYAGAVLLHNRRCAARVLHLRGAAQRRKRIAPRGAGSAPNSFILRRARGRRPIIRWPDFAYARISPPPQPPPVFEQSVYFPYLPGGHRQSAELNLSFPRRGLYAQRGIGISTRFPFSFLTKTRIIALDQEVLVFPSVEATDEMFEVLPMITGELETNQRGRGSDLYRIRDYEPEDSARHVDWKATAKSGELKVREYTREDERRVCIIFDNPAPGVLDWPALRARHQSGGFHRVAFLSGKYRTQLCRSSASPAMPMSMAFSNILRSPQPCPDTGLSLDPRRSRDSTTSSSRLARADRFLPRSGNLPTCCSRRSKRAASTRWSVAERA